MEKRTVYLIGTGMGASGTLTEKARDCINSSCVIAGAKRIIEPYRDMIDSGSVLESYKPGEIGDFMRSHLGPGDTGAVLLSGDVGFSSGARKLLIELQDFRVELIPGISSLSYFCSRLGISWESVCMASGHGKHINMIQRIKRHRLCFFLLEGQKGLHELCDKLLYYGMDDVILTVGENLSYHNEKIIKDSPKNIRSNSFGTLVVVVTENKKAYDWTTRSIPDREFIRTKVPMTKSEIRTISIGKLQLTSDSVVYDIGAGTGSVSIEIALSAPDIQVYSIEKNPEALVLLERNKQKFAADNVDVVEGVAPNALEELPVPTHVFIGGSSGNMDNIIQTVFSKNPACRIVVNTIALNSLIQLMDILNKNKDYSYDLVQVQTAVEKKVHNYQLMMGQNPIYIVTIWKENAHET